MSAVSSSSSSRSHISASRQSVGATLTTFVTCLRILLRNPEFMVWTLAFPLIMSTIFLVMFSNLKTTGTIEAVPVAVVVDNAWSDSQFSHVVSELSHASVTDTSSIADSNTSSTALLAPTDVAHVEEGQELLTNGSVAGVFSVDAEGTPHLITTKMDAGSGYTERKANVTILETIASSYVQTAALAHDELQDHPELATTPSIISEALSIRGHVNTISLTHSVPDETVRYYYALLAMTTLMAAMLTASAVCKAQPNVSALGARRCVAGASRASQLLGTLLGSLVVSLACLVIAFAYIRFVVGVDFQGREPLCLLALVVCALLATGLGAVVGAAPLGGGTGPRLGITTGLSCFTALFAGMYGEADMALGDTIARSFPAEAWLNPARLISDVFYSLYFYESLAPFLAKLVACLGYALVLLVIAILMFRRQRHEYM